MFEKSVYRNCAHEGGMNVVGIRHGEGMLFFQRVDGEYEPIGKSTGGIVFDTVEDYSGAVIHQLATEAEATFTLNLSKQQIDNFLMEVYGIRKMVLDLVGGRVAHLARHGRKHKTRKKNVRRAIRMLEMEE